MECDFDAAIPGAYWGHEMWQAEQDGRITTIPHDPQYDVYTAWDIGRRDDTAIWWYQVIAGEIRVIDYHASSLKDVAFYATQVLGYTVKIDFINDEIVAKIGDIEPGIERRTKYSYAKHWLPHDAKTKTLAAGKSVIEQLGAAVGGMDKCGIVPSLSVQDGIQAVRMMLPRIWFDNRCDAGIQALKQYQREYDEDKRAYRETPRHDWCSHPADAFRMLAISAKDNMHAKPKPQDMRGINVGNNFNGGVSLDEMWDETADYQSRRI